MMKCVAKCVVDGTRSRVFGISGSSFAFSEGRGGEDDRAGQGATKGEEGGMASVV